MKIPRLHPDTVNAVKERADIVDVVSEHVVLRKRGKDFVGLCPFHDDKSPSFTVSPGKQFYYCFSCGAGGNALTFVMELGKRSFSDAVLDLARRYQVPVQTLEPEERQDLQRQLSEREQLYELLALTMRFYEHALHQPQGAAALDYLRSTRRLSQETIQHFQLGYAPAGWETLYGYLVEQKRYPAALVEQAGLIVPRKTGEGYYDRFRDRVIIPIHDLQSRVVGFGGRALGDQTPKYLNSPETPLFDKGKILFGLDKARVTIAKQDRAVVVEGYFDVIALHAAGISNAVASLGTALSSAQVRLLLRYTESKQIVLNFDADTAGNKAAERAIGEVEDLAYRGDAQLRVLNLPAGKDADEFLQTASATDYQTLLAEAPLWLDWQIQQALAGRDLQQADQFQQSSQAIAQLLSKLPNATLRTHYIHRCAGLLSRGDSHLAIQLEQDLRNQVKGQRWHGRSRKWERSTDYSLREQAEAKLLQIYIHCPQSRQLVCEALEERDLDFSLSHHRLLWRTILEIEDQQAPASVDESLSWLAETLDSPTDPPDLLACLRDRSAEFPQDMKPIFHLLQPDELNKLDLLRAALIVRAATASLEKIMCERRCRHLLVQFDAAVEASKTAIDDGTASTAKNPTAKNPTAENATAENKVIHLDSWEARELKQRLAQDRQSLARIGTPFQTLDSNDPSDEPSAAASEDSPATHSAAISEAYQLQRLYYQERQYLHRLSQERFPSLDDLIRTPLSS